MKLEELFQQYKDISLRIFKIIDEDDLNQLDKLILERERILEEISKINEDREKLKVLYEKADLLNIENLIRKKMETNLGQIKEDILKLKKRKEANKKYNNLNAKAVFLSKKV